MIDGRVSAGRARVGSATRLLLIAAVVVMATGAGASAQSGGGCRITGSVGFSPGITYVPQTGAFTFNANLALCQAYPAAPASGTVSIGRLYTDAAGHKWQEPVGTLNGGCGYTVTEGLSIIRWADGTLTVTDVTNVSASGQIALTGDVIPSVTLAAVDRVPGQAETLTLATNRFANGRIAGQINVTGPINAVLLCATTGLPSVTIDGVSTLSEA